MEFHLEEFEASARYEMSNGVVAGSLTHESVMRNLSERVQRLQGLLRDCARNLVERDLISHQSMVALENDSRILDAAYRLVRRLPEWFCMADPSTGASGCGDHRPGTDLVACDRHRRRVAASIGASMDEAFAMARSVREYDLGAAAAHETAWQEAHRRLVANVESYCACRPDCTEDRESPIWVRLADLLAQERQAIAHAPAALQTLREVLNSE
ncbi:hypothetical protein [Candidatus Poriferisodalis sp.]|uniref:hypothetical protein n=1 Tax=Candidatus Poriferisodalis sp. TaxID=3101277 RepID=UPI003B0186D7